MNTPAQKGFSKRDGPSDTMQSLDIQGFTYEQRHDLLADLTMVFGSCGGWITDRKTLSPTNVEFRLEIQLRAILDLYAAIVSTGVELNRGGHDSLTELCTRSRLMPLASELGQVVALRLEIAFLEDVTLHSLLAGGACLA
jgi:hypothetical protein